MLMGHVASKEELNFHEAQLKRSLDLMERWLSQHKYLGGDQKTITDISACHVFDQLKFIPYSLTKWPKVEAWLHNMIDEYQCS
jgi:glutathione S-transferase